MKISKFVVIALGAALLPVAGAQAADKADGAETTPDSASEKVICRTEKNTGSLTRSTRTCKTSREWADMKRQQREQLEKMQQTGAKY